MASFSQVPTSQATSDHNRPHLADDLAVRCRIGRPELADPEVQRMLIVVRISRGYAARVRLLVLRDSRATRRSDLPTARPLSSKHVWT